MTLAQKKLRELRERQSKERGRMAELAVADELTDETRAELDAMEKGTADLERQLRAATVAVENEETEQRDAAATGNKEGLDTEDRERLELRSKARMGRYVLAAMENRSVDGAEGELNAAVGIGANRFPLELLAPPERTRPEQRTEDRAVTAADTQTMPRTWLDRLFAETAAMRLGITMESVPVGAASFPVTTAGASAAQRGKDQSAADTAWTVGVVEMKPTPSPRPRFMSFWKRKASSTPSGFRPTRCCTTASRTCSSAPSVGRRRKFVGITRTSAIGPVAGRSPAGSSPRWSGTQGNCIPASASSSPT